MTVLRMFAALLAGYAFGWPRGNVSGPRPGQSAAAAIADPRAPAELPPDRGEESGRVAWRPPSTAKNPNENRTKHDEEG